MIASEDPNRSGPPLESDAVETVTQSVPRHGLLPGEVLAGRFRILRLLGHGGMGEVFEAEDLELGGRVAVKIIRPDLPAANFLSRFRREVQLARQVTHPNVCRLFDVGRDESGRVFFTMELLEGQTLHSCLREAGKLSPIAALPLVRQMAEGLAALHEHGVVHRDLKPGNVMIVRSGTGSPRAVIGDFGLARATETEGGAGPESHVSAIVGTPDYISPEQLLGRPASPASDIYSFGIVLYEMVTGERPFPRGHLGNPMQRLVEQPKPPRDFTPELPEVWQSVILRCLAREPEQRPSISEIVETLSGPGSTATLSVPAPTRPRRWTLWAAIAAGAVMIPGAVYWGPRLFREPVQEVAILPLRVAGDDPALRVLADGLMDSLARRVARLNESGARLQVTPASEVRAQGVTTAGEAKAKLGAQTAVEGAIASDGGRIKVELSVVDTSGKRAPLAVSAEDDRANASGLEDALVARLGSALRVEGRSSVPPHAATAPGAHDFYLQARGYLQRPDQLSSLDSAVTVARRALEIDPAYALAHSALGEALFAKFDLTRDPKWLEEAMKSGRKAVELNANAAETHVTLARIHLGTGRPQEAAQGFEKALSIDSANAEALQGLASAFAALHEYDRAEATYRKAIELHPGDWTGYKQFGLYHARREDWDKAIEQYKSVIALTPDNAHGYANSGYFYFRKDEMESARKHWLRALELDPSRTSTMANLAKLYYEEGQYSRAAELYQKAIKLTATRSYSLWGNLGRSHIRAGNTAAGKEALGEAIKIAESEVMVNPRNADALQRLADYRVWSGRGAGAEDLLRRALAGAPDSVEIKVAAAETYATLGKTGTAVDLARRALAGGYSRKSLLRSEELRSLLPEIDRK